MAFELELDVVDVDLVDEVTDDDKVFVDTPTGLTWTL